MAADSVRMEIDAGGADDSAMPLLDNFDSLESKVRCRPPAAAACVLCSCAGGVMFVVPNVARWVLGIGGWLKIGSAGRGDVVCNGRMAWVCVQDENSDLESRKKRVRY